MKKLFKLKIPNSLPEYCNLRERCLKEGYHYTNETMGYMFFEKDIVKKREMVYIGGTTTERVKEEITNLLVIWNKEFQEKRTLTSELWKRYRKVREEYSREQIQSALISYVEEKKDKEKQYRLTPLKFLIQKNNGLANQL